MSITIDTNFPGGNACDIVINENETPPVVSFAADPHGGPETLWFDLKIRISPKIPALKLVLKHFRNSLGGNIDGINGLRPVIRSGSSDWTRMPTGTVLRYPDGRADIIWEIAKPGSKIEVAFCYPYGEPELETLLKDTKRALMRDVIGVSQAGRPIVRISNGYGSLDADKQRPGLYLISRQHSSETPGGWVLDGFLRAIASSRDRAPLVWCVPLSNIDGVVQGDYGKDNFPYDLNRAWDQPPMRHETLVIQRDMAQWAKRCNPLAGLDFHAPAAVESDGLYAFIPSADTDADGNAKASIWGKRIAERVGEFAAKKFCRWANYKSRWETMNYASFVRSAYRCIGMSFETPYAVCGETVMTREDYQTIGERMASAVIEMAGE